MPSNAATRKKTGKSLSRLVWQQVRPYRKWLLVIFAAMLLATLMDIATPWCLKIIIDNVINGNELPQWLGWIKGFFLSRNKMTLAAACAVSLVLITAIGAVAGYINNFYTESVAQYVANDVRLQTYHHLQRLSLEYYDTHQVGKILSTITTDVATMQDFVSSTLLSIVIDIMTITGILILMFYINWTFALMAITVTPFLLIFVYYFKKAVKKSVHEVRSDESSMFSVLQQGLESIRVVNAFGTQKVEEKRLQKISLETVHAALRTRRLKSLVSPVVTVTVTLCTAVVLWQGASLVLSGFMTIGALTVFLSYLNKFFSPVKDLAKMTNAVAQATVALERIQQIMETDDIIVQKAHAIKPGKFKGAILFENVTFGYREEEPVLKHITLSINAGQRVGICGPTGCGKSTVASLIPRFYDVTEGTIFMDGIDIRNYNLEGLRKQIGFVLQDTVLFYGTIAENIAYGKTGASHQEIIDAARLANAEEFISKMPHGYDTPVGERGLTLSGGQRQRIGIARAIIRNSPILILDEPTAALDTESEKLVMGALEQLMEGKTVITITHRLSTIVNSDKIVVINDGEILEEGSHKELMKKDGYYSEMYRLQTMADALEENPVNFNPESGS